MTHPSTTPAEPKPAMRSPHPLQSLLVLVFRLLALGLTATLATVVGVTIAHFYPSSTNSNIPLLERVFRQSDTWLGRVRRLTPSLSVPPSAGGVEGTSSPADSPPPAMTTVSSADYLTITLPSDTLFAADQITLRASAAAILDSVVVELQPFQGGTVRVAAHTDPPNSAQQETAQDKRLRSLAQAEAIESYLITRLGEDYHWVAVGYGGTRPLVVQGDATAHQRNRRVEITIDPQ